MIPDSMRRAAPLAHARRADWGTTSLWLLGFTLVAYLGLKGGGYDSLVHNQVGIAVWWVLLLATAVGALPFGRIPRLGWVALGLLGAFVLWTAASLTWTESVERTAADLARVTGYLGVLGLAVFAVGKLGPRRLGGAVAAGIVLVTVVGLLSRLHPAWFPAADQTAAFLSDDRERLSYPIHYWNAVAALIAIGVPLILEAATGARSVLLRSAAAAVLPAMALTMFFTLSRGGTAAALLALVVFVSFSSNRLAKLPTLFLAGAGSAILILAAGGRDALQHGLNNSVAHSQGNEMLVIALAVCAIVGLVQLAISLAPRRLQRPSWTVVRRRQALIALIAAGAAALLVGFAFDAPGRGGDAWSEFKEKGSPGKGAARLGSTAGQNRYQLWSAAVKENASRPLTGTGSGTFEYWWARNADVDEIVRDTHSLYLQTLGELGIVGLALLVGLMAVVLVGGARAALIADPAHAPPLAAGLAGCVAFFFAATFDWMWQIPVLPVSMLLLAATVLGCGWTAPAGRTPFALPVRLGAVAACPLALVAIAIPLAATSLVRQSESDFREGDLQGALNVARSAQNAEPGAATPRLQQALVLEAAGDLPAAAAAAGSATEKEATNWRTWLVLSRIEAERGRAAAAVADFREARLLNPRSSLFDR